MTSSGGNEVATIAALQALAVQTGKRGCSKAPDWKQVIKNLRGSSEEQALKAEKGAKAKTSLQARLGGKKAASRARRNAQEDANAAANHQTEFYGDGAIVEDGEEAPRQGVAMG